MIRRHEPDRLAKLRSQHLAEPDWLQAHLDDPSVRVVDMRGYVRTQNGPDGYQTAHYLGASDEYDQGHIPGAVYLDWTADIVDLSDPISAQVAGEDKIAQVLGEAGIGTDTLVVAYDNHPASQFATRLWWVLRYYGHSSSRVLNGGLARWKEEGRPLTSDRSSVTPRKFVPGIMPTLRKVAAEVLEDRSACIVDARDHGQYTGTIRRGPRGGHIPGAIHLPREALFGSDGRFKQAADLAEVLAAIPDGRSVIAYCNGGVAATSVLFALSMLGRDRWSNYDGSWNEWTYREDLPVEEG